MGCSHRAPHLFINVPFWGPIVLPLVVGLCKYLSTDIERDWRAVTRVLSCYHSINMALYVVHVGCIFDLWL